MQIWMRPALHPVRNLSILFLAWKSLLLLIAICSPGPGYDTSTNLALATQNNGPKLPFLFQRLVEKLVRWDGIYFMAISNRGYLYEQEWAFGWGLTRLTTLCTQVLLKFGISHFQGLEGLVAIVIAHTAHLFSVLTLFKLTLAVFNHSRLELAFTTAALQILSPAGIFLSASPAESCCAFLAFAGCLNFSKSFAKNGQNTASHDLLLILSGVMFGAATTFRSNGILNGIILLDEAFRNLLLLKNGVQLRIIRRLAATGIGGLLVAAGFVLPQYIAYTEYCTIPSVEEARPWCTKTFPSIYTFVQDHYWNVGLFRYWTISNLPLFLLAMPMFAILIVSTFWSMSFALYQQVNTPIQTTSKSPDTGKPSSKLTTEQKISSAGTSNYRLVCSLGYAQILLTTLTLFTAHVQIITRISSAYPVWLWYIAINLQQKEGKGAAHRQKGDSKANLVQKKQHGIDRVKMMGYVIQFMVLYSIIQAGLYASFLPPA